MSDHDEYSNFSDSFLSLDFDSIPALNGSAPLTADESINYFADEEPLGEHILAVLDRLDRDLGIGSSYDYPYLNVAYDDSHT